MSKKQADGGRTQETRATTSQVALWRKIQIYFEMNEDELRCRLAENGLEIGQEKKEKEKEPRSRSISVASESHASQPEKKRKREEKEKKKREEDEKKGWKWQRRKRKMRIGSRKRKKKKLERRQKPRSSKKVLEQVQTKCYTAICSTADRCNPSKMEQQANYERKLPHEVLVRTPNYVSRLEELKEHNKSQIEAYRARMLREEQEAEKKKKEKEARKAARKEEKRNVKEEEKMKKAAMKAAKKEKKKKE